MIHIFGAGLAGLIAAKMLQDMEPTVCEKQSALPNNHSAVLRFRSEQVSIATNVPFQKVRVLKAVKNGDNPISDAVRYARKVTGTLQARSILELDPVDRWIAPPDFVARLAKTATICYGIDFEQWSNNLIKPPDQRGGIISTIPVPIMMDLFKWSDVPEFNSRAGWTAKATLKPELGSQLNCTIYYPGQEPFYRASITGSSIMIEGVGKLIPEPPEDDLDEIKEGHAIRHLSRLRSLCGLSLLDFGLTADDLKEPFSFHESRYQKIDDLDVMGRESVKRFIMWLSKEHGIYSLGRFATWRPKLLLDDIVNDVRVIRRLIESGHGFDSLAL